MGTNSVRFGWIVAWVLLAVGAVRGAGRNEPLSTGELLVDLARDHGLTCKNAQTPADLEHIRILLRAATRLNPRLSDAYAGLHELAVLRGDARGATEMARQLLANSPGHVGAFASWLDALVDAGQTVEQRTAALEAQLQAHAPPEFAAMIHVRLSQLALARGDRAAAREQVDQALALDATLTDALELSLALLDEDAPPDVQLRAALKVLSASPLDFDAGWRVAGLLDGLGLVEQAAPFFDYALNLHQRATSGAALPANCLLQLGQHAIRRGQFERALEQVTQAVAADAQLAAQGGLLLHWLLKRLGRNVEADGVREQLGKRFAGLREPQEWPVNEVAQAAWFYGTLDPQPQRALMLAEAAVARAPGDVFVRRVLGWAQAADLKPQEARQALAPIARQDAFAAGKLAVLLKEAGDEAAARRVLAELTLWPTGGPAQELLGELDSLGATTQPAAERFPAVAEALAAFDRGVLEFYRQPGRFLELEVSMPDRGLAPGEPWWVELALTNRGKFPITLGPRGLVNPVFLLSFEMEGDRKREYPNLLTINVDQARVIRPGASLKLRRTVDLGPLRRASRLTPQQLQRVTLRVLLDPVCGTDGQWRPALGGQTTRPLYFNRQPAGTSREALHALFAALAGDSDAARFRAVETITELLSEAQRASAGQLSYRPAAVPMARLQQALLSSLSSESWELRARTLDALQIAGMDVLLLQAVGACLDHPHWVVRLLAMRLLGNRQGPAAAPRLQKLADGDPDELVRGLAQCYLDAWESAASSQPASAPTEERG